MQGGPSAAHVLRLFSVFLCIACAMVRDENHSLVNFRGYECFIIFFGFATVKVAQGTEPKDN